MNEPKTHEELVGMSNEDLEAYFLNIFHAASDQSKWPEIRDKSDEMHKLASTVLRQEKYLRDLISDRGIHASRNLHMIADSFGSLRQTIVEGGQW